MKKLSTIFIIFILIFFASQKILAWTNYVSAAGSDTAPYDTWAKAAHNIQDAVNYAVEGNAVLVTDGTYTVSSQIVIVTNNIILKSVNGAASTAIDGNTTTHCIYLRGISIIDGFFIRNGKFSNGGGIFVQHRGEILNCNFTNNLALISGGAINAEHTLISNCYFKGNSAVSNGGAVHLKANSSMKDCVVEYNSAINGGAVFCTESADISDTVINNNNANSGGGITVDNGSLTINKNCFIRDNVAIKMGGGIYANNADVSITGTNTFLGVFYFWSGANYCTNGDGGGVYAVNSDIVLSGEQCYAGYNYSVRDGGAFYITNSTLSLLDNSQINFGWTSRNGGGIYAVDSEIIMANAKIMYCGATNGGGIFAMSSSGSFNNATIAFNNANTGIGGGICTILTGDYYFVDSVIANNSAINGGGIVAFYTIGDFILNNTDVVSNQAFSSSALCGGIFWNSLATLEANNSRVNYNFSHFNVGGAYLIVPGKFLFNNTDISYNYASNHVGGVIIANAGQLECVDCSINSNVADVDTNGVGNCGAIYVASKGIVDLISMNGTFTVTNNSGIDGGAIYVAAGGKLSTYGDVLFENNRASQQGGAMYVTNQGFVSLMPTNGFSPRIIDNFANNKGGGAALCAASEITAVNPEFANNISSNFGGAIYINASTATVYGVFSGSNTVPPCAFISNKALYGGGIYAHNGSLLNISDTLFVSNSAYNISGGGGAVRANVGSVVNMINSILAYNDANHGGGIAISGTSFLQMKQCIVTKNGTDGIEGGTLAITNSIFWNNTGTQVTAGRTVDYCDVDGGYATGNGNIDVDPMFQNAAALDFRLALGSPCIDTGTIVNVHNDCIGDPRPMGGGFDLGAYELNPAPLLKVVPLEIDFGDVIVGESSNIAVQVENLGNSTLNGTVNNVMNPIFSVQSGSPYIVTPLSSNLVSFRFSPIVEISNTNIVTFQSNGGNMDVTLIGTGIPEGGSALIIGIFVLFFWEIKLKLSRL